MAHTLYSMQKDHESEQPLCSDDRDINMFSQRRRDYLPQPWYKDTFRVAISIAAVLALLLSASSFLMTMNRPTTEATCSQSTKPTHSASSEHTHKSSKATPTSTSYEAIITSASSISTQSLETHDCGSDMETALQKGCQYDVLLAAWTPPQCYNQTLLSEYWDSNPPYEFFRNQEGINSVRPSLVETGRYMQLFTSNDFHLQHCLYYWRKQIMALAPGGAWVEEMVLQREHAEHCATRFTTELHSGKTSAKVLQTFQKCVKVNGYM